MIRLENVTKIYNSEVTALRDATFEVAKGEFVFLVGPSGSGKSTLLLATGQLVREALLLATEPHQVEHGGHLLADHVLRAADDLERERDVLVDRLVQQQLVVLEDVADVAPQVRHLAVGHVVDVATGHQ